MRGQMFPLRADRILEGRAWWLVKGPPATAKLGGCRSELVGTLQGPGAQLRREHSVSMAAKAGSWRLGRSTPRKAKSPAPSGALFE